MGAIYFDDKLFSGAIDNIVSCSLAEYNALTPAEKNNGRIYMITDQNANELNTIDLRYNNLISGLTATNVQEAIDEVANTANLAKTHVYSYIGMIIQSTTLDTEAKVKEIYGGTTWIQHDGYMLRGATTGVIANNAVKTGGEDTHTLTVQEMPSHNHGAYMEYGANANPAYSAYEGQSGTYNQWGSYYRDNKTAYRGGGQAHNNLPSYKSVYIWERTE